MRIERIVIAMVFALGLGGCDGGQEEDGTSGVARDPGVQKTPNQSNDEESSPSESGGGTVESSDREEAASPEVAYLPTLPVVRRQEDEVLVRIRHSTRSILYPIPNGWEPEPEVEGADWLDQMRIPAPFTEDYADAFVTVFASDGEELDEVLNRWLGQVNEPAYTPEVRELDFLDGTPLLITEFVAVGTYDPGGIEPQPETMVIGAMIEGGPEGALLFKGVGPRPLMEANRYRWDLLMRSLRIVPGR